MTSTLSLDGKAPARRKSFTGQISALLTRRRSNSSSQSETASLASTTTTATTKIEENRTNPSDIDEQRRSVSRGRDFTSSGRGGIGNIRRQSASRDPDRNPDLPEVPLPRGREPVPYAATTRTSVSVGRGGAGNIRSPSRDRDPASVAEYEQDVIRRRMEERQAAAISSGRGGAGNISPAPRSPSHSRSRSRARHSTGRGGAGNIRPGDGVGAEVIDEEERREHEYAYDHAEHLHSTGRGGLANMTAAHPPPEQPPLHVHENEFESTGRGGRGNIRARSQSRDARSRSRDALPEREREKHGGLQEFWNKVTHAQGSPERGGERGRTRE
ncbi:hypothetical protein GLOTRDRAFT_141499 [Gloeophyllum trabeum ATCC 11539]|uniref:Uncharacterized protein n=1 Tax=Gloeophyllum trabeum (strain ATCC 11539 / FP-39264 / Madison 617) TaxID=670483 RepID=S7RD75_GLOTA|nr:uncharacterized protein GLOTRDRAFT_141499 [Gloeophyllum trabeum ATCC 11539]EPQ50379.1 hypothetical protein GLOTRDRAFT_141499 [Gloeophyllum trabeum ATCC 11539]